MNDYFPLQEMYDKSVAVAESITGGLLADLFVSSSGSSKYFYGAISPYSLAGKVSLLNVDQIHAEQVNCVSATVARQMACGVAEKFSSDFGVSTTGYAEAFLDEQKGQVLPHAHVCVYNKPENRWRDGFVLAYKESTADRNAFRKQVADAAKSLFDECYRATVNEI